MLTLKDEFNNNIYKDQIFKYNKYVHTWELKWMRSSFLINRAAQ